MEWVFWIAFVGSIYSYFLYPLGLVFLSLLKRSSRQRDVYRSDASATISIVIAVHNEESRISDKLDNTLALNFPDSRVEIVVVSDGSTDGTESIVRTYSEKGVVLIKTNERRGKEYAQDIGIRNTSGSVIVFSDVGTILESNALQTIERVFRNERVGAVSSEDVFVTREGQVVGEGVYVRYEMWLRRLESRVGGVIGLSGSLFAARREVCGDWDDSIPSDISTAMRCVEKGYTAVVEPELKGMYSGIRDERKEYQRKWRTAIRGMAAVWKKRSVLNPMQYGLWSIQLLSHKVMRWLVPWFLGVIFVASASLAFADAFYTAIFALQVLFYTAVAGWFLSGNEKHWGWLKIPGYFVQANVAVAHAGVAFLTGKRVVLWEPSRR